MSQILKIRKILGNVSAQDAIWALQHGGTALERKLAQRLCDFAPELRSFPHRLRSLLTPPSVASSDEAVLALAQPQQHLSV